MKICRQNTYLSGILKCNLFFTQIVQNDVDAHRDSVDSVKEAGKRVLATEHGGDTPIKRKLGEVNELWEKVQQKSASKFKTMKDALKEAKSFTGELQDLLLYLADLEGNLISSTQIGGLPETAKEQLERFMVSLVQTLESFATAH